MATGTQIASDPVAYRLDYRLDARGDFVTRSVEVIATGRGWSRRLDLRHDGGGRWTCQAFAEGDLDLPAPGCEGPSTLAGAIDCDLGRSPLTNMMPIRRTGLARPDGRPPLTNGMPIPAPGSGSGEVVTHCPGLAERVGDEPGGTRLFADAQE